MKRYFGIKKKFYVHQISSYNNLSHFLHKFFQQEDKTPSESTLDGASSVIEVFTITLGSVLMSSCNCGTSFVKVGIPEMVGVTRVLEDVETQVSNKPIDFDLIK